MMVKFVSNDKIEGEGFKAVWYPNCGGVYEATQTIKNIESPNFHYSLYPSNIICNYTLIAPNDQEIIVDFMNFHLEGKVFIGILLLDIVILNIFIPLIILNLL
jgi:cubilin